MQKWIKDSNSIRKEIGPEHVICNRCHQKIRTPHKSWIKLSLSPKIGNFFFVSIILVVVFTPKLKFLFSGCAVFYLYQPEWFIAAIWVIMIGIPSLRMIYQILSYIHDPREYFRSRNPPMWGKP
jgi:hypothetical protein